MNRNEARQALKGCSYLHLSDRAVYLWLLLHADNADSAVPERYAPTLAEVGLALALSRRAVYGAVRHLELHSWLVRDSARGRGRRNSYRLVPAIPDTECHCEKVQPRAPIGQVERVHRSAPTSAGKGATSDTEKVQWRITDPPESLAEKHSGAEGIEGVGVEGHCQRCERPQPGWLLATRNGMCVDCARRAAS